VAPPADVQPKPEAPAPDPVITPSGSDGILTETAGREQAAQEARLAANAPAVPWESDLNRTDLGAVSTTATGRQYDAFQVLAIAAEHGLPGEPPETTIARATAYKEWITQ